MGKDITSEEKLLKLIRKKQGATKDAQGKSPEAAESKGEEKKKDKLAKGFSKNESLKFFNTFLIAVLIAISGYAVVNYVKSSKQDKVTVPLRSGTDASLEKISEQAETAKPYEYYQGVLDQRDIFMSPWEKPSDGAVANVSGSDFSKQYKLVGIVLDENPQAILENISNQSTFFVHKGETVGDATVEEIREGAVILLYNNEKIELIP